MVVSDFQLRNDVEGELDWDARLDSRQIGVAVREGIVALSGHVSSYSERCAAEQAALAVAGVRAVANDIVVELPEGAYRSDPEIAAAAVSALRANITVPADRIRLVVQNGWITLHGAVVASFQKEAATSAVKALPGVKGISVDIVINSAVSGEEVQVKIQEALRRRALLDAGGITVRAEDGTITLEGAVHCWQERQEAETAASRAPGVSKVINNLHVNP